MAASDEELMRRAASDDVAAFGELFDRHQRALYAFLCRLVGNASTAEDVAQEAFGRAWQHRRTYAGRAGFRAWLYAIARRAAVDEARKPHRRAEPFSQFGDGVPCALPDGFVNDVAVREQIGGALRQLPEEQRLAVLLREYDQLSYREIGEVLACSEVNARVLCHRARRALRDLLRPLLESEESCV